MVAPAATWPRSIAAEHDELIVVWHSVMRQYLEPDEWAAIEDAISAAAADRLDGDVQSPGVRLTDLDTAGLVLMRTHGHDPALERAAAAYSRAGEHAACWLALGLAGAALSRRPERREAWLRGVGTVAASYGVNQAVKFVVRRRRPRLRGLEPLTPVVTQLSFPSAHATTSFAAARAYTGLASVPALYAAAVAFGLSRPYLGVHYPSDVLAGCLLGTAVAELLS